MELITRELVAFPTEAQTKMEALSLLSDALWREKRISSKERALVAASPFPMENPMLSSPLPSP